MNDDIERLNEENRRIDNPPKSEGDFSKAKFSSITHPDEDKKIGMAESIIQDLGNQRQEIDAIKEMMKVLIDEQNGMKTALNQITNLLNQSGGKIPERKQQLNMDNITAIGQLIEKGAAAYKNLKGSSAPAPPFIDPEYINEQVKASVMGNFEIGNALISNLKSKLINKAVTASVTEALKDTHAPQ